MRDAYGSAAYDFDLFLPAQKREKKDNITPIPQKSETVKKSGASQTRVRRSLSGKISTFLAIGIMLGMTCAIIHSRVAISEARVEINQINREIEVLEREEVRLNMLIENKSTYENLEEEAAALGMQKPTADQIRYIALNEEDKVEIGKKTAGSFFAELAK